VTEVTEDEVVFNRPEAVLITTEAGNASPIPKNKVVIIVVAATTNETIVEVVTIVGMIEIEESVLRVVVRNRFLDGNAARNNKRRHKPRFLPNASSLSETFLPISTNAFFSIF
jgi:hypothetical protein